MAEKLNIQAVARLVGLNEHTIRAWEKRYRAITPARGESGRRTYSLAETERLQLLSTLVRRGHAISTIATLPIAKLKQLLQPKKPLEQAPVMTWSAELEPATQAIIQALRDFELETMIQLLAKASLRFDIRSFVYGVALPIMNEVGMQVDAGKLLIAQEHALSVMLRDQLGQMLKTLNTGNHSGRRIALATPAGDIHEFGIMLSGILSASHGWSVQYLGPNLPPEEFARACAGFQCEVALLGTTPVPAEELKMPWTEYLKQVDEQLASGATLWIGGAAAKDGPLPRLKLRRRTEWIRSLEQLENLLSQQAKEGRS